jgi:hypothetical protein
LGAGSGIPENMFISLLILFASILITFGIGALVLIQTGNLITFVFTTGIVGLFVTILNWLYFHDKYLLSHKIQIVCEVIFKIAMINFWTLIVGYILFGGTAFEGKIEDGYYFIGSRRHLKDVPAIIYYYSLIHTFSVIVTHPLAIFAGWIHIMTGGKRNIRIKPEILKLLPRRRT